MTELLAHLDSWLQSSRCVMQGDSYVVDSRTMKQSKFILTLYSVYDETQNERRAESCEHSVSATEARCPKCARLSGK